MIPEWLGGLGNALVTLAAAGGGAWAGAMFAYRRERQAKREDEQAVQIRSGQRVLATLLIQINTLVNFQRSALDPFRDQPHAWLPANAESTGDYADVAVRVDDVVFLFGSPDGEIAMDALLAGSRFRTAIDVIQQQSRFAAEVLQPEVSRLWPAGTVAGHIGQIEQLIGIYIAGTAKRNWSEMLSHVDRAIPDLVAASEEMVTCLRVRFSDAKFSYYGGLKQAEQADSDPAARQPSSS